MSVSFAKATARQRITQVVEGWFLTEPLLFAAWTMHDVVESPSVATIRAGRGRIEFNSDFVTSLRRDDLRSVLSFEAMRILLGHPYSRRQPRAELSYQASSLTVQECLRTKLPIPRPRDVFGDDQFDDQYFEFYYRELSERATDEQDDSPPGSLDDEDQDETDPGDQSPTEDLEDGEADAGQSESGQLKSDSDLQQSESQQCEGVAQQQHGAASTLKSYSDPQQVGAQNTAQWDNDDLQRDEINAAVREAAETNGWGTISGGAIEQLKATLNPKLDYRGVLRGFRQSVLSVNRRLTRMKPSRRYGYQQMGSRYEFTTRLLFAVDVSGSMGSRDLQLGFSVVSRFFRYGVESIDVIWFDESVLCDPMTLRRARADFTVTGRGGTNFTPLIEFIDQNRVYDGLIVFTDGYAPVPPKPLNTRTQICWLFKDEATYQQMNASLQPLGRAAFIKTSTRAC